MTEQEIIKAWKENLAVFQRVDSLMKKWAKEHMHDFEFLLNDGVWLKCSCNCSTMTIYRLRPDYNPEPEVIELEIKYGKIYWDEEFPNGTKKAHCEYYTHAPALCPKEGYRFAGYRYADIGAEFCLLPTLIRGAGSKAFPATNQTIIFPTHAIYKKVEG